jgi:hypothetical protein
VSIAQQIATPTPGTGTRRPSAPLRPVPVRRPGPALLRIVGLIGLTALGAALLAGTMVIGLIMFASSMGA